MKDEIREYRRQLSNYLLLDFTRAFQHRQRKEKGAGEHPRSSIRGGPFCYI